MMTTYTIHKHGSGWRIENTKGQVIQPFPTREAAEIFRRGISPIRTVCWEASMDDVERIKAQGTGGIIYAREPVCRPNLTNRVEYDEDGLNEIVTDGGVHIKRIDGDYQEGTWALTCYRADGSSVALTMKGYFTDFPDEENPAPEPAAEPGDAAIPTSAI